MMLRALSIGGRNWFICLQLLLILMLVILFKCTLSKIENLMQNSSRKHKCSVTTIESLNLSALIPKRIQLNNSETYRLVEEESNLAIAYWEKWKTFKSRENMLLKEDLTYCDNVVLTSPDKLKHNNLYWQQFDALPDFDESIVVNMYLYNAYYDNRVAGKPVVQLITMNNHELVGNQREWFCLLWFDLIKQPILVPVSDYYNIWPTKIWRKSINYGSYHPQLISCPVPESYGKDIPRAVSLQSRGSCSKLQQEPSNVLRVKYEEKRLENFKKPSIGVCVQALRFGTYDMSVRLVEWLEMIRLLGADQVYLYALGLTENMRKVLQHYKKEGFVQWRETTLPGTQANINSYYNMLAYETRDYFWPSETLELNDCLYRNLYQHDYIALIDIDEIILPQNHLNWHQLIKSIEENLPQNDSNNKIAYYNTLQSRICESNQESTNHKNSTIPEYLYMMRHTHRAPAQGNNQGNKCIFRTDRVTAAHIHFPARCFGTVGHFNCKGITLDPRDAQLMHFRRNKTGADQTKVANQNTECPIHDRKMWRYYDEMENNVRNNLEKIFL